MKTILTLLSILTFQLSFSQEKEAFGITFKPTEEVNFSKLKGESEIAGITDEFVYIYKTKGRPFYNYFNDAKVEVEKLNRKGEVVQSGEIPLFDKAQYKLQPKVFILRNHLHVIYAEIDDSEKDNKIIHIKVKKVDLESLEVISTINVYSTKYTQSRNNFFNVDILTESNNQNGQVISILDPLKGEVRLFLYSGSGEVENEVVYYGQEGFDKIDFSAVTLTESHFTSFVEYSNSKEKVFTSVLHVFNRSEATENQFQLNYSKPNVRLKHPAIYVSKNNEFVLSGRYGIYENEKIVEIGTIALSGNATSGEISNESLLASTDYDPKDSKDVGFHFDYGLIRGVSATPLQSGGFIVTSFTHIRRLLPESIYYTSGTIYFHQLDESGNIIKVHTLERLSSGYEGNKSGALLLDSSPEGVRIVYSTGAGVYAVNYQGGSSFDKEEVYIIKKKGKDQVDTDLCKAYKIHSEDPAYISTIELGKDEFWFEVRFN